VSECETHKVCYEALGQGQSFFSMAYIVSCALCLFVLGLWCSILLILPFAKYGIYAQLGNNIRGLRFDMGKFVKVGSPNLCDEDIEFDILYIYGALWWWKVAKKLFVVEVSGTQHCHPYFFIFR
jgi:hypothetical protein